jgi:hypothetical protein
MQKVCIDRRIGQCLTALRDKDIGIICFSPVAGIEIPLQTLLGACMQRDKPVLLELRRANE